MSAMRDVRVNLDLELVRLDDGRVSLSWDGFEFAAENFDNALDVVKAELISQWHSAMEAGK